MLSWTTPRRRSLWSVSYSRIMATLSTSLTLPLTLSNSKLEFPLSRPKISTSPLHSISNLSRFRPNGSTLCSMAMGNDQIQDNANTNTHTHTHTNTPLPQLQTCTWNWRGYSIRYQCAGSCGPALVLVHGFGANSDHWRKNVPVLAKSHRVYAIDLIGYGYSDKPNPHEVGDSFYTFETWASQLNDFCSSVVKDEAFFICNSIGGLVGLQAAVLKPQICKGILLLNISLRMLHIKKQPWFGRPFIAFFQSLLRNTAMGKLFYKSVATPASVRSILFQVILHPGLEPGAVDVFLEFICYSGGPLPEELLPQVKCPVLIAWGDKDPWEPIELGRDYGNFDSVEDFIILPNVGHCPQDEAPHFVNPLVESFVARHSKSPASASVTI
ncbi:hypothetical protein PTKIN_Ptkin03bG0119400 [Pterospermum kingtungense]